MYKYVNRLVSLFLLVMLINSSVVFADVKLPQASPGASISQTVGLTNIEMTYSRPGVKGRVIWGELVPYNKLWRTGANKATSISFSDDVTIDGKTVPAGKYALFTIPGSSEWTVILNKNSEQWGGYNYQESEDLMRFTVKPMPAEMMERMCFAIEPLSDTSAEVVFRWEKRMFKFPVQVSYLEKAKANIQQAMAEVKADDWQTPYRCANFYSKNKIDFDQALRWMDQSIAAKKVFWNLSAKARIFAAMGNFKDAVAQGNSALDFVKDSKDKPDTAQLEAMLAEWKNK